jgi:hypothetical protein
MWAVEEATEGRVTESEKNRIPTASSVQMKNTDATLGGLPCGAIQREADEQDRLTQRWSLVGGAGGR